MATITNNIMLDIMRRLADAQCERLRARTQDADVLNRQVEALLNAPLRHLDQNGEPKALRRTFVDRKFIMEARQRSACGDDAEWCKHEERVNPKPKYRSGEHGQITEEEI